mmetsp:Transcript_99007/g.288729  ORF Transcript_99007/g.288729 Transcript_99007/m.288729 type:complete len:206 (-) Transcript_99007:6-623(-)
MADQGQAGEGKAAQLPGCGNFLLPLLLKVVELEEEQRQHDPNGCRKHCHRVRGRQQPRTWNPREEQDLSGSGGYHFNALAVEDPCCQEGHLPSYLHESKGLEVLRDARHHEEVYIELHEHADRKHACSGGTPKRGCGEGPRRCLNRCQAGVGNAEGEEKSDAFVLGREADPQLLLVPAPPRPLPCQERFLGHHGPRPALGAGVGA